MPNAHPVREDHSTRLRASSAVAWFVAGVFFTVLGVILLAGGDPVPGLILSVAGIVVLGVVVLHAEAPHMIERPSERDTDLRTRFPGRYLSVTSFKRDGTGVATPVWFVSDGRRLFAFTDLNSAKIRRIRHNPSVLVAACRPGGKLRRDPVSASAEILTAPAELERVQKLLLARYKLSYPAVMLFYRLGRRLRGKPGVAEGAALAITLE